MNIVEKIQRIKYLRLKPEERFLIEILDKVEFIYDKEKPDSEFYMVDGDILFEQDSKNEWFWVDYVKIWKVLELNYDLKQRDINKLIKGTVWKKLKRKVNTPAARYLWAQIAVWKKLKRKVNTPTEELGIPYDVVWERLKRKVDTSLEDGKYVTGRYRKS